MQKDELRECDLTAESRTEMAELFGLLSDPSRLGILEALAEGERCVHEIAGSMGMSQSAVSHQLRLLRQGRLVRAKREGQHMRYRLDDDHVRRLLAVAAEHCAEIGA
jgi:DNA-binding transcriptional ArsR family regulator